MLDDPDPDELEPVLEPDDALEPALDEDEPPPDDDPLDPPPRGDADPVVCPLLGREPAC